MQDTGVHNVVDILIQNAPKKIRKACNANKGQTQHANHNLKQLGGEDFPECTRTDVPGHILKSQGVIHE